MKKKFLLAVATFLVFGLAIAVYAFQANTAAAGTKASCCAMADCCKDGHCKMGGSCCKGQDSCPMKDKQDAAVEQNMSNVVVAGDGESCCKPGADCCKGGACCHGKTNG
jgi:hypothetical protein